jgi:type IVB pilus formation R64 PilN family outer membrane protein
MQLLKRKIAASVALAIMLTGCSSTHTPKVAKALDDVEKTFEGGYDEQVKPYRPYLDLIGREHTGAVFLDVDNYDVIEEDERKLPVKFNKPVKIKNTDEDSKVFTLDEFAAMLFKTSGVTLDVSSPDLKILIKNKEGEENSDAGGIGFPTPQLQGVRNDSAAQYDAVNDLVAGPPKETSDRDALTLKKFDYAGDVRGLLDYVSIANGIKWKYDESAGKAYMYAYETEFFELHDFNDDITLDAEITTDTQQTTDNTTGGSSKNITRASELNAWEDIKDDINNMLTEDVGRASFSRKYGMVTVTDSDYVLNRIKKYVDKKNDVFGKEVILEIRFIQFSYTEGDNKSISQNYLNSNLQNNLLGSFDMEFGTGSLSPNIGSNLSALQEVMSGNFLTLATESQEILLGMLNNIGTAKTSFKTQVEILNNDTFADQKVTNQEYIDSIERSNYGDENSSESITTEKAVAVDGLNLTARPRIIGDEILLNYTISNSDFISLDDAGLGSSAEGVQLKREGAFNIDQTVKLKNGIAKVVKFTHEDEESVDSQGLFSHFAWWLGGNEDLNKTKNSIIVTITAYYNN